MTLLKRGNRLLINPLVGMSAFWLAAFFCTSNGYANPVLDHVAAGNISVQETPNTTVINQSSQQTIINWRSFNIGAQESTHFQQPAGGVALNRINPNQGGSSIYGRLTATGQIILVNPAGIYFGPGAYVNVGGLIASTADISDQNFLNGYYHFNNVSLYPGSVVNKGQIIAADHGLIALLGNGVQNDGLIQANLGKVVLAAGEAFTMTFAGNELVSFSVDQKAVKGISNTGTLGADGGSILVTAQTTQGILDNVINMTGIVEARSVAEQKGEIILSGDKETGIVNLTAEINASGKNTGEKGGNITITGYSIQLGAQTKMDVSGDIGGGNIFVGGNSRGQDPLPNATALSIEPAAQLLADAITQGNGGNIILWSNESTRAYGAISAQGGLASGNGGFVETSGHQLDINGIQVDVRAAQGNTGSWLLDPTNIYIAADQSSATTAGMSGTNTSADTNGNPFTASGTIQDSLLQTSTLITALAGTNVIVTTTDTSGTGTGNITVVDPISWSSANTLTLTAANNILINAAITTGTSASSLILNAAGSVTQSAAIGGSGSLTQNGAGTVTLSQSNTYTGSTIINAGTLSISSDTNLGTAPLSSTAANLQFGGGKLATTASFSLNSNRGITLNAGGGTIAPASNTTLTYNGVIIGNNAFTLDGTGTLALGRTSNYTGTTTIRAGTLRASSANRFSANSAFSLTDTASAILDLNGFSQSIASLTGGGTTGGNVTLGSGTLTIANAINDSSTSYAGVISGTGGLTINLAGTGVPLQTLIGSNTYSGTTTISAGTLVAQGSHALGTGTAVVASGAELLLNGATLPSSNTLTLNGTGINNAGALATTGSTTNTVNGNITLGTSTSVNATNSNDTLILNGTLNGAFMLTLDGSGNVTLGNAIGNSIALTSLTSNVNTTINTSAINTTESQLYNGVVTLGTATTTLTAGANITFNSNLTGGGNNLNLIGTDGSSGNIFTLTNNLSLSNLTITGGVGNNTLALNTNNTTQTWSITGNNSGTITGLANVTSAFSFSNINNLTGGGNNTFKFSNGAMITGSINGGAPTSYTNTLDISSYTTPITAYLTSTFTGNIKDNNQSLIAAYGNINQLIGNYTNTNIDTSYKAFTVTFTSAREGYIDDPIYFYGFSVDGSTQPTQSTATVNVASIIQQPVTNNTDTSSSSSTTLVGTPAWIGISSATTQNMSSLVERESQDYTSSLSKVKINPTCLSMH